MTPGMVLGSPCIRRSCQALAAVLLLCTLPLPASAQPESIDARAASGDTTLLFWFDEDVNDTTATDTSNFTLSGGLTIDSIRVRNAWTTVDSMPTTRDESAAVVIDGKIYVAGGNNGAKTLEIYDPESGTWSTGASLVNNRVGAMAVQWQGRLWLYGGSDDLFVYDPRADAWTDMNIGNHFSWGAGGIIGGKLYYAAQYELTEYDFTTEVERSGLAGMPSGLWWSAYGVIEGKLYVAGGEPEGNGSKSSQLEIYDQATNSWSIGASLPVALSHGAGAVMDGKLYVSGGITSSGYSDKVYEYDPNTDSWATMATLPFARYASTAISLKGELHVMGGHSGTGDLGRLDIWSPQSGYQVSLASGQSFRADTDITITASNIKDLGGTPNPAPLQKTFTPLSWSPPTLVVAGLTGTHSGNITIPFRITDTDGNPVTLTCEYSTDDGSSWSGATTSGTITDLDPADYQGSLTWQSASDLSDQHLSEVQFRITPSDQPLENGAPHTSIFHVDNLPPSSIEATGLSGYDTVTFWFDEPVVDTTATNPGNITLSGLTSDNISVQNWQSGQQMPSQKSGSASTVLDGELYVIGGDASGHELQTYDPASGTWSQLTSSNGWRDGGAAAVLNDRIYLIGSGNGMEYYDPGTDTWTWALGDYGADQSWCAFEEMGGFLYIAAGDREDNTARKYNPTTNSWTDFAGIPTPRRGVVSAVIDGRMYVAGGETGNQSTFYSTLEVYDPETDTWATMAPIPKAIAYAAGDVVWGKFVVAGGFDGTDFNSDVYVYDPATDSWSTESTIPNLRWKSTATTIDNKLYFASGFHGGYVQALDIYDLRGEYTITLSGGDVLPPAETSVTISATGITDRYGNTLSSPLQANFYPETGQVPSVDVGWPVGTQTGNVTFSFDITDAEGNPVSLDIEYSTDNGGSWQTATTTGTISGLYPVDYSGSFTWQSATDYADQEVNNLRLRITPSDNATTPGTPHVLIFDLDNRAPVSIGAQGASGDTSFTFWFSEPVPESTAVAIPNYSLSGGYGIASISVNETWDRSHTLGITPVGNASVTELDGKLYIVGGKYETTYHNRLEVFDPVTDTWTALAPLPSPRAWAVVAGLNGKLYVLSGENAGGRQNTLFAYDVASNSWNTLGAPPLSPCYWDATAHGIGGKLYVNQNGDPSSSMFIYDPATDSWTNATGTHNTMNPATAVIDGRIYLAGGEYHGGGISDELSVYDPKTGTTSSLTLMPTPRHRAVGGAIDGKFYVVGGWNNSGDLATLEIYDPASNSWSAGPDMPVQRSDWLGAAVGSQLFHGRAINFQGTDYLVFDMLDRGIYDLILSAGQKLPPPPDSVTITASNINDLVHNTITGTLEATLTPSSGQAPAITIYGPGGFQGGDIPIDRIITDAEGNPVWLKAEYQLDGETTWNPATVQGDTADIAPTEYTGTLIWQSGADLASQTADRVRLRITPRDNGTTWGTADTLMVSIDNLAPTQITAGGTSGGGHVVFWFDEPVQEDTATSAGNFALSGGLTIDGIDSVEEWEYLATTAPARRWNVGIGTFDGRLVVAGGQDDGGYLTTVELYDPDTGTWSSLPDLTIPRQSPHVFEINGKLYVISGH
ncbi:Kelch repeat-containing protein, partial [Gemmatimonadota bacterium]